MHPIPASAPLDSSAGSAPLATADWPTAVELDGAEVGEPLGFSGVTTARTDR